MKIEVKKIAEKNQWPIIDEQDNIKMISFKKGEVRINVYWSTMTVATCLNHPAEGKTQLFRKNISLKELELIFKKPRRHTGKGYYKL